MVPLFGDSVNAFLDPEFFSRRRAAISLFLMADDLDQGGDFAQNVALYRAIDSGTPKLINSDPQSADTDDGRDAE